MRTVEDFGFRQTKGKFWKVTRGQVFDGKGMPPLFSYLLGPPYEGSFRKSSMVYESATQRMTEKWDEAQRMFFEAAVAEGVAPRDAKVMYLLLALQGSRWEVPGSRCFGSCHGVSDPLEWRPVIDEASDGGTGEMGARRRSEAGGDRRACALRHSCERAAHLHPAGVRQVFGLDAGSQELRLSGVLGWSVDDQIRSVTRFCGTRKYRPDPILFV